MEEDVNLCHHRIATRVLDTGGAAKSTIVNKTPTYVHWMTVSPEALGTAGVIKIYDGFDTGGKLVWQLESGYGRHYNFLPPILCEQGVFVYNDAAIASWVMGYHAAKGYKAE